MDNKMKKIDRLFSNTGKVAKNLLNNAVQIADQNDDGTFDFADVTVIAETMGNTLRQGTESLKDITEEKARLIELKRLRPIFTASLNDPNFLMPKFIRITNRDKKYIQSEVCRGSIGYESTQNGTNVVNLFRDSLEVFNLTFYPDCNDEFYYVDPYDSNCYIALDDYFMHLKEERINELRMIAEELGAKYFKVTYMEEQISFSQEKGKVHGGISKIANIDMKHELQNKKYSSIRVEAKSEFPGHDPIEPQLKYLKRDSTVQALIKMRMEGKLINDTYLIAMKNTSGIKKDDAVKIDGVLKGLKCSGNATVTSEVQNESRRYLEYDIRF